MDLLTAWEILVRRRMLLAAALAVAGLFVLGVYVKVPPTYQVSAILLVLKPSKGPVYELPPSPVPGERAPTPRPQQLANPYLTFDSSSFILAGVVTRTLDGDA